MNLEITIPEGYHKSCKYCGDFFLAKRRNQKYCSSKCRKLYSQRKARRKARWVKIKALFGWKTGHSKEVKPDYSRLTFLLSVIGFIGSLGFYFGVLRQVYSAEPQKQKIEQLEIENQELKELLYSLEN